MGYRMVTDSPKNGYTLKKTCNHLYPHHTLCEWMRENRANDWDTARWLEIEPSLFKDIKRGKKGLFRRPELAQPMRAWGVPTKIVGALLCVDDEKETA